jgi:hypothetical protein
LIDRATDVLSTFSAAIDPGSLADLRSTHASRNNVVHRGARAVESDAAAAAVTARHLLDLLPIVSSSFSSLPPGGGVATAVASVLPLPDIAEELLRGDRALLAEDALGTADAAGYAHGRTMAHAKPRLELKTGRRPFAAQADWQDRFGQDLVRDVDHLREQVNELRQWVVAPVLGMTPDAYGRLGEITGRYTTYATTPPSDGVHRGATPPTIADARWALERVAEIAYRMWETGAIAHAGWGYVRLDDAKAAAEAGGTPPVS